MSIGRVVSRRSNVLFFHKMVHDTYSPWLQNQAVLESTTENAIVVVKAQ